MNRLDEVVGPENWWDDYTPLTSSVMCRLTVRLPDGQVVTKCDLGGCAGMADAGDDDKSGFSDAFKRAAVKFGAGRYLYNDGVATLASSPASAQIPEVQASEKTTPPPPAKKSEIKTGHQLLTFAESNKIDPTLKGWIVGHFTRQHYPARIADWTPAQVAKAQPEIRAHLEAVMASKKETAA
jgi:hypothetical protein